MLGGGAILPKFIPLLGLSGHVHDHFLALHMDLRLFIEAWTWLVAAPRVVAFFRVTMRRTDRCEAAVLAQECRLRPVCGAAAC